MARELSEAPECFLFDCCILITRFTLSSCYSSVKTRIQLVKSYQINESFCITCCALLCIVYCLIAVSAHLHCPEHQSLPIEFTALLLFSNPNPNPNPHLNRFFSDHFFPSHFCTRFPCTNPSDLQACASPI